MIEYEPPDWLQTVTHQVRFSPNCPKQFEVRLPSGGVIDSKPVAYSKDRIGYGKTLAEAAEQALSQHVPRRTY